ncbi:hypothetical protein [Streptomyces finlayi]|uniref:hypothetical protein n=1 Tax=Streptomyces finlayi TaxID=67296 RepID=UPI00167860EA|nr:hypothetical protein [Streptomyces finlayi]
MTRMSSSRRYGRISAAAVAAVVLTGIAAPAAFAATPAAAPTAATAVAPSDDVPIKGGLLTLDLAAAVDLDAHGVVVAAVDGAVEADAGVSLAVAAGSKVVTRNEAIVGGTVVLKGGVKLTAGAKSVVVSGVRVDLATGVVTANVGAKAGVRIGTMDVSTVSVDENASLVLDSGLTLDAAAFVWLDTVLGVHVFADLDADVLVDAWIEADVDARILVALGLNVDIDLGLGIL